MGGVEIFRMIQEVGYDKCFYKNGSKPSLQAFSSYSQYNGGRAPPEILQALLN